MKRYSKYSVLVSLLMAALLLTIPAAMAETTPPPEAPQTEAAVEVSTVDELLAAIAPEATIVLKEGEYDLSTASDYGMEDVKGYYDWELVLGGAQLNISGISGLHLVGQGKVSILARPRYAEVLRFSDCEDLHLEGLTLGHTQAPESCAGGVLSLFACNDVRLDDCRLFGCGILGVTANGCRDVVLTACQIDSCSSGAVMASACRGMRLEDCKLLDNGFSQSGPGGDLLYLDRCRDFALVNCEITGNFMQQLLQSYWSDQVAMLGCRVEQNHFLGAAFRLQGHGVTVDKCAFRLRDNENYYAEDGSAVAVSPEEKELTAADLGSMEHARAEYAGPAEQPPIQVERTELPDGRFEVHAATVDELIAAIAPNTTIRLDAGDYDLTTASEYGGLGGDWYCWETDYDGCTLKLLNVPGLSIVGAGKGKTVITIRPRYAAVFRFQNCDDLNISGITAGHSEAPGYCSGNVLDFDGCWNVTLDDCGLYGCGVLGIWATNCAVFTVRDSEIYDCSNGAAEFYDCMELSFEGCSIHDCEYDRICLYNSEMTWNGQRLTSGAYGFRDKDYTGEVSFD